MTSANAYSNRTEAALACVNNSAEESAKVYDQAYFLMGLFHIFEWVRTAVLLSVTCMEGMEMLMWAWHITTPINALFGVVVYIYAQVARFNSNGVACAEV